MDYKEYEISPYSNGFQISPNSLIRIASFIVHKADTIAVFAFAEGMLTRMANPELNDSGLLQEAEQIIKTHIDNNRIRHLEEYAFEYHPSNFIEVSNPQWWTKSLKEIYG